MRFFLAPMAGITDSAFRLICREQGAMRSYTEMVSAKGLIYGSTGSFELLQHEPGEGEVFFQLFGSEPAIMAEAVAMIEDGIKEGRIIAPAGYDINMGCPMLKIVRSGEGAALMKDPAGAARIVEAIVAGTERPVTVKMRTGWDGDSVNATSFAREVVSAGAAAVCVHGRTREQFYGGRADWAVIGEVQAAVGGAAEVYGSGDIFSAGDAARMLRETGCDAVMAARGVLGNPWIFRQAELLSSGASPEEVEAAAPSIRARADMFIRHARLALANKGEYTAVREMRKHAGWYFKGQPRVTTLRNSVNHAETMKDLEIEIENYCDNIQVWELLNVGDK